VIHNFLIVDGEWVLLMIVDDYSQSCGFCAQIIGALTCLIVLVAYTCLQGELVSLVEFDAWFDLPWIRGSIVFCIEKPRVFFTTLLSSELDVCYPYCLV
jgi:hypothetical protein